MFHYSVRGDNKNQVKKKKSIQVAERRLQCERHCSSLSWLRGIDQPVHIKLEVSAVLQIRKGHSRACGINAQLSVFTGPRFIWLGGGLMFSKNNYQNTKEGLQ